MIALESISNRLGIAEPWVENGGVHWMNPGSRSVRDLAAAMSAVEARFVTITAYQLPANEGFRLEYHWDLNGRLLGFPFQIAGYTIESIVDLCEAADWIEREVHEGFAIEFTDRTYEPLLLRPGDKPGVNLREDLSVAVSASGQTGQKEVAK